MKRKATLRVAVVLLLFLFVAAEGLGSLAFATCTSNCKNPNDKKNYKDCKDCQSPCIPDVTGDGKVTTKDVTAVDKCYRTPACRTNPCSGTRNFDLNGDGVCNSLDVNIVRKCLGCCITPSPFK